MIHGVEIAFLFIPFKRLRLEREQIRQIVLDLEQQESERNRKSRHHHRDHHHRHYHKRDARQSERNIVETEKDQDISSD